jgi:AcrR family transcriptional regulator
MFSRYGYRRTSIDAIAQHAGAAKGTVYAYFEGKEALFHAVCEHVVEVFLEAAEVALRKKAPIDERLLAVLDAKYSYFFELALGTPHAQDLLDAKGEIASEVIAQADRRYLKLLVGLLDDGVARGEIDLARSSMTSSGVAAVLMRSASGVALDATSVVVHRKHLAELVRVVISGLGARGRG